MKFEDRVQLKLSDLTEELFEKIVAYGFCAPSGMGGPGCVIMIAEDGRSYQFYGPELNNLNYYREWHGLYRKSGNSKDYCSQIVCGDYER